MPSWWSKSSSKEVKNKASRESFIDTLHRKFKSPTDVKVNRKSEGCRRRCSDTVSELGSQSRAVSRSPSPTKLVSRCQSFIDRPRAQPLPLPGVHPASVGRTDSTINVTAKTRLEKGSKSSLFPPLPRPACIRSRQDPSDLDADLITASVSSETSSDNDDHACSSQRSPQATDYDLSARNVSSSPSSAKIKDQVPDNAQKSSKEAKKPANPSVSNYTSQTSSRRRPLGSHVPNLQVPHHGALFSAPDSSMSSPSRSPMRTFGNEQVINSAFWVGKPFQDVSLQGSGHCSSPGSGYNSGHNSMGGDMSGQLFWQHSRGSPECSPIPSPRMNSPGAGSRVHSGAVTPIHPRAGGATCELQTSWPDDGKQQSHRLPLPPGMTINTYSHSTSPAASPSVPRSPGRAENPIGPGSRWKKGKLLGRGTFGHVYVAFNSESGEMCAMKEVTLVSDDAKSKESAKQLMQEIALLSCLRHPNIVQYYGSKRVGDKLYIYLEYVSGGSIYKILQEYGELGELAIRSYAQQIVSGLAYLHSKNTVHRDIKGANILVDPNGRVKLADFGMAKHVIGQSCPLSFKGSPYWMAPEVIKNSSGCNLAVDIWSLGCTVLEMATTKPPWSQYEGVAAIFKIGNSKDLPAIPAHLSDAGKDFVRLCLQRNPQLRPTATQLLEHPFVKHATPLERPILHPEPTEPPAGLTVGVKTLGIGRGRNLSTLDSGRERLTVHSSRFPKAIPVSSDNNSPRNISCPVSPIGSPHLRPRSPQHLNGRMSPSPISTPRTTSGSSTPLTGGSGAVPYNHVKQSIYMQQGLGNIPKSTNGVYVNAPSHHDSNPELFLGMQLGTRVFSERVSSENDILAKHLGMSAHRDNYDGQTLLDDCVSRQLLRDPVSLDLSPKSPLPHRTTGVSCNVPF